jgi:predicted nucleic acid-binding protein
VLADLPPARCVLTGRHGSATGGGGQLGNETVEELDELLPASAYEREALPYTAGFAAGKAFMRYRRSGGDKRSPMPDFHIGAHAAVAGYRLLTRDVRRYQRYFPTIEIIAPAPAAGDARD